MVPLARITGALSAAFSWPCPGTEGYQEKSSDMMLSMRTN